MDRNIFFLMFFDRWTSGAGWHRRLRWRTEDCLSLAQLWFWPENRNLFLRTTCNILFCCFYLYLTCSFTKICKLYTVHTQILLVAQTTKTKWQFVSLSLRVYYRGGGGGKLNSSFAVSVAVRWNPAKGILECFKLQSDWQGFLVLNAEYYMWVGLPPQIKTFQ